MANNACQVYVWHTYPGNIVSVRCTRRISHLTEDRYS